ncbi:hypothetical protein CRYUN_Cryun21dG0068000 [Craigia yunnanensis]
MQISKIYLLGAFILFLLSFTTARRPLLYEIKRLVPSGPNPEEPPATPFNVVKDPTSNRVRVSSNGDYQHEGGIRRSIVRSGPNLEQTFEEAPFIPSKKANWEIERLVPGGPNPEEPPFIPSKKANWEIERLVPGGPNPEEPPFIPSKKANWELERLVPSGPNPEEPPIIPSKKANWELERLVPSGPNPEEPPSILLNN